MKYLCLIYTESTALRSAPAHDVLNTVPQNELNGLNGEYFACARDIQESGHFVGGNNLEPVAAATTVRVRNGEVSATGGPFADTKEQLGGYFLIDARDLNEAIQVASRIPMARTGCVEVRPVREQPKAG